MRYYEVIFFYIFGILRTPSPPQKSNDFFKATSRILFISAHRDGIFKF